MKKKRESKIILLNIAVIVFDAILTGSHVIAPFMTTEVLALVLFVITLSQSVANMVLRMYTSMAVTPFFKKEGK